jgi:hypothetical protein
VKLADRSFQTLATCASVGALAVMASFFYTGDPDIYWHLATARAAIAARSLLPTDPFSFSVAGTPWHHKDLLAECILYLGFSTLGYAWFAALKGMAALATTTALHASVPRASRGPLVLVALAGLLVQSFLFIEQPAVFSVVLFAGTLALEETASASVRSGDERALRRRLGAWVGLNFLWTWLHRFSVLGHGMLLAWAGLLLASRAPRRVKLLALGAAVASPVLALANPSGLHALWSGSTMASHPELRAQFWEWKSAGLGELWDAFPVALVVIAGTAAWAVGRGAWATRRRQARPVGAWHLGLLVALALMTRESVRWMPYLTMVALAMFGGLFGGALTAVAPSRKAVLLPLFGLAMVGWYGFARRSVPYAIGEDPAFAPRGAVAFAREHGLSGRVANAFDLGGYLLWADPAVKVLVDGRSELVYPPDFVVRCLRAEDDDATFAAMRAEDGATWAVGSNAPGRPGFGFLPQDPLWMMVYWSDAATVYVRIDAHRELEALGYRFIDVGNPVLSVVAATRKIASVPAAMAALGAEVRRMVVASPDSVRALMTVAVYDDASGPSNRAERDAVLAKLLRVAGGAPTVDDFVTALLSHH